MGFNMIDDDIIVKLENVHKMYALKKYRHAPIPKGIFLNLFDKSHIYALKEINLIIRKGESVAIIGPNGSGKSTLLLLISGILIPTKGRIFINEKTGVTLHLGLTFQEDLTTIENIYLYGVLLGLSRKDISKKINKILKFSELEDFTHVPIKNISAGMKSRLAFSIAIHTNPEYLVLDEILSVGDASFQDKCMSFFKKFKKEKKTLILVSHDLDIVKKYFDRCIYLDNGQIVADGPTDKVVALYEKNVKRKILLDNK